MYGQIKSDKEWHTSMHRKQPGFIGSHANKNMKCAFLDHGRKMHKKKYQYVGLFETMELAKKAQSEWLQHSTNKGNIAYQSSQKNI